MLKPETRLVVGILLLATPGVALAQGGVNIDHKAVGCIVAGKYPKMNACFSPASQLARARVYFRPEEGPPNWYYVEMKSDAPCFSGVLPKPSRKLVGKNVLYYLDAFDQKFVENRTGDNPALVVKSEGECKKDIPVAAWLSKANVVVFPSLPAGFSVGGLGTGTIAAAALGGAAVVGGGVAIASGGGGGSTGTTPTTATTGTTLPAPTTTAPTTTTTVPAAPFRPVFLVTISNAIDCFTGKDFPPQQFAPPFGGLSACYDVFAPGTPGINAAFNMCGSDAGRPSPPYPKLFYGVFLDGTQVSAKCETKTLLSTTGYAILSVGPAGSIGPSIRTFNVVMGMNSAAPGNNPQAKESFTITVEASTAKGFRSVPGSEAGRHGLAWVSQLDVPGASGQVVVNGSAVSFSGPGRSTAVAAGRRGENRIEAQLVQAAGVAGTWRFELGPTASLVPGSLRVLAGNVAEVSGDAVVFRLAGRAGERVVFTFRTSR